MQYSEGLREDFQKASSTIVHFTYPMYMQRFAGIVLAVFFALMHVAPAALTCCLQPSCLDSTAAKQEASASCCCTEAVESPSPHDGPCELMPLLQSPDWTVSQQSNEIEAPIVQSYLLPHFVVSAPLFITNEAVVEFIPPQDEPAPPLALVHSSTIELLI